MGLVRLLLAVSVLITHSAPIFGIQLLSGDQAVTCFYVVSGFLMMLILSESYTDVRVFYVNRVLRIFPAFLAALALNLLVLNAIPEAAYNAVPVILRVAEAGSFAGVVFAVVTNLFLLGGELGRYLAVDPVTGVLSVLPNAGAAQQIGALPLQALLIVPQAWTLSIELQFYAVVPWLKRWREAALGLVAVAGLFVVMSLWEYVRRDGTFLLDQSAVSLFQFPYFILGMCGYGAYRHFRDAALSDTLKRVIGGLALASILVLILTAYDAEKARVLHYNAVYALFALMVPFAFHLTKHSGLDAAIGELSYPVYLFHFGIAMLVRHLVGPDGLWGVYTLLATLGLSALYVRVVDRRVQRVRRRIADRQTIRA